MRVHTRLLLLGYALQLIQPLSRSSHARLVTGLFSSGFVMKEEHGFGFYVE